MKTEIDLGNLPKHVAVIMDGNGRWAKKRFLSRAAGHKAGADTLKKIADESEKLGISYLTVYAFSTENWKRSDEEVSYLMGLMRDYIQQYIDASEKNNMRLRVIGNKEMLDQDLQEKISYLEQYTKNKSGLQLIIALSYGGRDEIVRGVKDICVQVQKGAVQPYQIDEVLFARYLDAPDVPDPDLLIRTSGENRLSNFLLWQIAYSELYFSEKLWPDFDIHDLKNAIIDYQGRTRRFGKR